VSVARTSRSVIALALGNDAEMLRHGQIPVSFRILEQGDGGNIQIIYAGPSDVEVFLVGVVEGVGAPRNLRATVGPLREPGPPHVLTRLLPWMYVLFLFLVPIPAMLKHLRHQGPRSTQYIIGLVLDCMMFLLAIIFAYFLFFQVPYVPTPPFGF
jgi:hypothetical protein